MCKQAQGERVCESEQVEIVDAMGEREGEWGEKERELEVGQSCSSLICQPKSNIQIQMMAFTALSCLLLAMTAIDEVTHGTKYISCHNLPANHAVPFLAHARALQCSW